MKTRTLAFNKFSLPMLLLMLVSAANLSYSCNSTPNVKITTAKTKPVADTLLKGNFAPVSQIKFDSMQVDKFIKARPAFKEFAADFKKFYRLRNYSYAWYDNKGLTEAARNVITQINNQQSEGILSSIPDSGEYHKLLNNEPVDISPDVNKELMLTGQYFNYAKNAFQGSASNKAVSIGWFLPRKKLSYSELLEKDIADTSGTAQQNAVIPQYTALKDMLVHYQQLSKDRDAPVIPYTPALSKLKPGDTSAAIGKISKRLWQLGDLKAADTGRVFNDKFTQGLKQFKTRHGLTANTSINSAAIKQLNVPMRKRVEQLLVNMERMRWVPVNRASSEFLLVNIPEYRLHYYEDNKIVWDSNVVVGKTMNKTVIFSGNMQYVVFSPYWYVPQSIINKEIRPGMRKNPSYLSDHRMEWNGGQVRQKPGPRNSLGLVKFLFPNSNAIYLHDTPQKSLFSEDERAFSHGCVRVAKARELAIRLLRPQPEWTTDKIDAAMHRGVERSVTLKKQIPVYIGYFTAFVDRNGLLNFRTDVYGRDDKLLALIMK